MQQKGEAKTPGSLIRVYNNNQSDKASSGADKTFIPYCNISLAHFSFHGHKDSVRFFVCVPSDGVSSLTTTLETRKLLVVSGGDGYIDFRYTSFYNSIIFTFQARRRRRFRARRPEKSNQSPRTVKLNCLGNWITQSLQNVFFISFNVSAISIVNIYRRPFRTGITTTTSF